MMLYDIVYLATERQCTLLLFVIGKHSHYIKRINQREVQTEEQMILAVLLASALQYVTREAE